MTGPIRGGTGSLNCRGVKNLSHWSLELCPDAFGDLEDTQAWNPTASDDGVQNVELVDSSIKWELNDDYDSDGTPEGDSRIFSFTLSAGFALDDTDITVEIKTGGQGTKTGSALIAGPDCDTQVCSVTTLGNDIVDQDTQTVTNTLSDPEGIAMFEFVKLENFTVSSITDGSGNDLTDDTGEFSRSGNTWTWQTSGTEPQEVKFVLQATGEKAVYFLKVTNGCGTTGYIDPPYDFRIGGANFTLGGNYPNPFSSHTTVQFQLAERVHATLAVYNVMGQKVATLVDASMPAGSHEVVWNGLSDRGQKLASGLYFYRLEVGTITRTKRMTLIR